MIAPDSQRVMLVLGFSMVGTRLLTLIFSKAGFFMSPMSAVLLSLFLAEEESVTYP